MELCNFDKIEHIAGGDKEFVKDILQNFLMSTPELINELQSALINKIYQGDNSVAFYIHKIFTLLGYAGLDETLAVAKFLEIKLKAGNLENVETDVALICENLLSSYPQIKAYIEQN